MQNEDYINEASWFDLFKSNEVFDFLKDAEEDIYTMKDGKPIQEDSQVNTANTTSCTKQYNTEIE